MNARRLIATMALAAVVTAAAGCGGGGAAPGGGGGGSGGTVKGGILRVGTTNYIDSLNPFVAIESQSYNAFVMEYPAARAVRPRREARGRLGDQLDAVLQRAHLDVPPEGRRQVV